MKEFQSIITIVFKALALAMGVATLVLNWLEELDPQTGIFFLALGLILLSITALQQAQPLPTKVYAFSKATNDQSTKSLLTEREKEIVECLADALSNKEIAERLFLAEGTVKNYLTTLMQKLGAESREEVVVRARELRIIA